MNGDAFEALFILVGEQVSLLFRLILLKFALLAAPGAVKHTKEPASVVNFGWVRLEKDQNDFEADYYFEDFVHDIFFSEGFETERALVEDYKY